MPKVSIIIPVYNVEMYISKCIDSCINQSFTDIEIIAIDDGSSDNSLSILEEYSKKDKRIVLIKQRNEGVSVARNRGIEISKAKWIMFLDSDDWLEEKAVEKMYEISEKNDCDILITGYYAEKTNFSKECQFLSVNDMIFNKKNNIELVKNSIYRTKFTNDNSYTNIGVPWAKLYNKEYVLKNNIRFKKGLKRMQDMIFNLDAFYLSSKIVYCNIPLYHYRLQNNSVTKRYSCDFSNTAEQILNSIHDFKKSYSLDDEIDVYLKIKSFLLFNEIILLQFVPKDNKLSFIKKIKLLRKIYNKNLYKNNRSLKINKFLSIKLKIKNVLYYFNLIIPLYIFNKHSYMKYSKNNY